MNTASHESDVQENLNFQTQTRGYNSDGDCQKTAMKQQTMRDLHYWSQASTDEDSQGSNESRTRGRDNGPPDGNSNGDSDDGPSSSSSGASTL